MSNKSNNHHKKKRPSQVSAKPKSSSDNRNTYRKTLLYGWMGLLLVLPFLRAQTFTVFSAPKFFVSLIVIIILLVLAIIGILLGRLSLPRTSWEKPVFFYTLVFITSTIFSVDRHISFFGAYPNFHTGLLPYLLSLSFFYVALISRPKVEELKNFLRLLTYIGVFISFHAIFERYGILHVGNQIAITNQRAVGLLGNSDYTISYMIFIIPFMVYFFSREGNKVLRAFYTVGLPSTLFGLFILSPDTLQSAAWGVLKSTKGLIATFSVIAIISIIYIYRRFFREIIMRFGLKKIYLLILGLLCIVILSLSQPVQNSIQTFIHSAANQQRFWAWNAGIKIGKEHIFLGSGPATVSYFLPEIHKHTPNLAWVYGSNTDNIHNETIDNFAMMGILGLIGYILLWGIPFYFVYKGLKQGVPEKDLLVATAVSIALFIGFNQFFFTTTVTMFLPWFGVLLVLLLTASIKYYPIKRINSILSILVGFIVLFVSVFLTFWSFRYWIADYYYGKSEKNFKDFGYSEKATNLFPFIHAYWKGYGYNLYYYCMILNPKVNNLILDEKSKETVLVNSAKSMEKSIEINPRDSYSWAIYGTILLNMKSIDQTKETEAQKAFSTALELESNNNPLTYLEISKAYEQVGDFEKQKTYLDQAQLLTEKEPRPHNYRDIKYQITMRYADMYRLKNDRDLALECYKKATEYLDSGKKLEELNNYIEKLEKNK